MPRKVIIDCDPGIDDAVALCLALFDPRLEVVATTATAGNVAADQATINVQAIVERLDPPRLPRIGAASPPDFGEPLDAREIHGEDGLGNAGFVVSRHHHRHASEKIICDEVRAAPDEVTIICLGPLTNVARALQRDPDLTRQISRLIIVGGSVTAGGNVTPAAEFNIYFDPKSAQTVFRAPLTKTLIPLDVTQKVPLSMSLLSELPDESTRAGKLLRHILPFLFRAYHQTLGQESVLLHDAVAIAAALHPELFQMTEMAGDVETRGSISTGATIFDRRSRRDWRDNMEVATDVDAAAVLDCLIRGLRQAGAQSRD